MPGQGYHARTGLPRQDRAANAGLPRHDCRTVLGSGTGLGVMRQREEKRDFALFSLSLPRTFFRLRPCKRYSAKKAQASTSVPDSADDVSAMSLTPLIQINKC
jgi:hypothetical protein